MEVESQPTLSTAVAGEDCSLSGLSSHCVNPTFIDTLPEPFLGIARECIPNVDASKKELPTPSIRVGFLEIQLRSQLMSQIQESLVEDTDAAWEDVGLFWNCALDLCCHIVYFSEQGKDERYKGMSVRRLPLLLLEDALDALPLPAFQKIWESNVEPAFSILFCDLLWHPSPQNFPCSLPFIKLCNKFLKRLYANASTTSEWPGRILLILAKAFPLSDKSATKIWGSFNTDNVTEFETQDQFLSQQLDLQQQRQEQQQRPRQSKELQTYSFYETFWSVQQDFSNPTGIKVADFLERLKTIIAALESHPLIRSQQPITATNAETNDSSSLPPPVKYLTNSHLLPIQLGDPIFRIQFLTQFLIVENHLSSESSALCTALLPLQKRAKDLIRHIQPFGPAHLQIVANVLTNRESHWRHWKKTKCQPDLETPFSKSCDTGAGDEEKKKHRLMDRPLGAAALKKRKKDEEELLLDFILHEKKDLKATCSLMASNNEKNNNIKHKVMPSLEDHLAPYVDALDPDAGIEPEYHPKNDSLFTWRALRLLSRDHLGKFHMINHKGDFEQMVRHIYSTEKGIIIPGEYLPEELSLVDEGEQHVQVLVDAAINDPPDDEGEEVTTNSKYEVGENRGDNQYEQVESNDQEMEEFDRGKIGVEAEIAANDETQEQNLEHTPSMQIDTKDVDHADEGNEKTEEPTNIASDEENVTGKPSHGLNSQWGYTSIPLYPVHSKEEPSEGAASTKEEADSEDDEGEIEESKAGKALEADESNSAPGEELASGIINIETPQPGSDSSPIQDAGSRGNHHQQLLADQPEEGRAVAGKPQEQYRRGLHGPKDKHDSLRPTGPHPHGGGGIRNDDRHEGPKGYSSHGNSRDHGRSQPRQHPRGGGSDAPERGGIRDHGPQGGRGGPSRPVDDRWEERRGASSGGGPGRRDDRRSGGGGGHRQGDRRGGRGGDQRRRYN